MPCAYSLYYVISNIIMTVQSLVMRKIYDPDKMKAQVAAEIAARRKDERTVPLSELEQKKED